MAPRVSVILPCFNAAATLPACLDALFAQTEPDFEIVAADDGSTDATADILREHARRDGRLRPLFLPHAGVAHAANAAMQAARAPYLARQDADDISLPERLRVQADLLDARPGIDLAGCLVRFGGDRRAARGYALYVDWTNTLTTPEEIALNRFVELPAPNPSLMVRADAVRAHGGFAHGDFPEDYEWFLRLAEAGCATAKADAVLYLWNDPPTRLTRTDPRYEVEAFYAAKAGYLARWLARHNPHHPRVRILGSGRITRQRARMLRDHGVVFEAYHDVDPRKVGHVIRGVPVLDREEVPPPGSAFCLSFVASRGARQQIAAFLAARGHVPGEHWLACA